MSTRWSPARRADLGLDEHELPFVPLYMTNRAWYVIYRMMTKLGARSLDSMAAAESFIPTHLARHWGECIVDADMSQWFQIGRYDGRSVQVSGIAHSSEVTLLEDEFELTPLVGTLAGAWLTRIGKALYATPTGLLISGKPQRKEQKHMSVNLTKGGKVDLAKQSGATPLEIVRVGLGWDVRKTDGQDFDLDASIVGIGVNGYNNDPGVGQPWFVYYNNLRAPNDAIVHQGDELTGGKTGDDEQILIDLTKIPDAVAKLIVLVTIFDAHNRNNQSFSMVENAFVRVVNEGDGIELGRYDLSEDVDPPNANCVKFAEIYKHNGAWQFKAYGDGFTNELQGMVDAYKIGQ